MNEILCWKCGNVATITRGRMSRELLEFGTRIIDNSPTRHQRCYCQKCFEEVMAQNESDKQEYKRLKKKVMFETAIENLERQDMLLWNYKEAIETVEQFNLENPDKFDSSYEIIAAIILIQNRINVKVHHRVADYIVDFYLPDMSVILEIDGDRHKYKRDSDSVRDYVIKRQLGDDWEVIRIKTEYLDKHADRLLSAIRRTLNARDKAKYGN